MITAYDTLRACGYCSINLVNVATEYTLQASVLLDRSHEKNIRVARMFRNEYCSEVCLLKEAIDLLGAPHKAALTQQMREARPLWIHETFDLIATTRGCRGNQVAPVRQLEQSKFMRAEEVGQDTEMRT